MQLMRASKISLHLNGKDNKMMGEEVKKCADLTLMKTITGKINPNDRYDVRSRDCHATDAQMSYEYKKALQWDTSGGASNFLAHKDLELFEEAHHWNMQAKFYSVRVPT